MHRELTCRGQDEHLRDAPRGINRLDGRYPEGKRLTRPGPCLADEILTIQKQWQRRGLNRCRLCDAHEGQRIESGWTYGEMGKRRESFFANREFRRNDFQWQSILRSNRRNSKREPTSRSVRLDVLPELRNLEGTLAYCRAVHPRSPEVPSVYHTPAASGSFVQEEIP